MPRNKGIKKMMASAKFASFVGTLIDAKVASCAEIGEAIGCGGNTISDYKYFQYDEKTGKKTDGKQCSALDQDLILDYLINKMVDADHEFLEQYRDLKDYVIRELREWYDRTVDIYDHEPCFIDKDFFTTDRQSYHKKARECFETMSNSEKDYILKNYFWSLDQYDDIKDDLTVVLKYIAEMPPEIIVKKYPEINLDVNLLFSIAKFGRYNGNIAYYALSEYYALARVKLACKCMGMARNIYSEYSVEENDEKNYCREFEKHLLESSTGWYLFDKLAPLFLKMTSEKWVFFALYLIQKAQELQKDNIDK